MNTRSTLRVSRLSVLFICFLSCTVGSLQLAAAQTWDTLGRIPSEAMMQRVLVSSTGAMYAYTADENTESWRSLDGGKTWHVLLHQGQVQLFKDGRVVVAERDPENKYRTNIMLSSDNGFQWKEIGAASWCRGVLVLHIGRDDRLYTLCQGAIERAGDNELIVFRALYNEILSMAVFDDYLVAQNHTHLGWTDQSGTTSWTYNNELRGNCNYEFVCGTALDSLYVIISNRNSETSRPCPATIQTNVGDAENWHGELTEGETWDIALFDALTAYASNSVLGVVRRDVDGMWFQNSINSPQCHDLFAAPDGALYALDSTNTVFRLPQADQPYKRLAFTGEFETSSLLNKTERDSVHILNTGIAAVTVDSLRLSRESNSPLRIVYEDMQLPFVLQPGEKLAVHLETMFTASDSSEIYDTLTVYAGELRLSETILARANLPSVEAEQSWADKISAGREINVSLDLWNIGTHPFRLDSLSIIADSRLEYIRYDSAGFNLPGYSSRPVSLPAIVNVDRRVKYAVFIMPLVRDTISLFIRYYTDFGELEQTVNLAVPEFRIANRSSTSKDPVYLNANASAPFSLWLANTGNIDYNIDSICLISEPDVLSIDTANLNPEKYLACHDVLSLPVRAHGLPDTTVVCTVILKTEFGELEQAYALEVIDAELPSGSDWTTMSNLPGVNSLKYNGNGAKLGLYSGSLIVLDARDGVTVGAFRHNRAGRYANEPTLAGVGDVGMSWDGRLIALGARIDANDEKSAILELMDVKTRKIINSTSFPEPRQRIHSTRFLPGDSLVAMSFVGPAYDDVNMIRHEGKFGVYSLRSNTWKYLNEELPSRSIDLAADGRFVQFRQYFYYREWSGSHYDFTTRKYTTFLYDMETEALLDVPFRNCTIHFSQDGAGRMFHHWYQYGDSLLATVLQRSPIHFTDIPGVEPNGAILPDGEHYAYIPTDYWGKANLNFLRIVHLKSGGIVVGECFEHDVALNAFAISPDGSKIAFVDVNGLVWQQDLDCEFEDIRTVDVDEADVNSGFSLRVSPNPTNSLLLVAHPQMSNGRIRILDMTGRESLSFTFSDKQESQVNVESLSPGVYCLEISDGSHRASIMFVRR